MVRGKRENGMFRFSWFAGRRNLEFLGVSLNFVTSDSGKYCNFHHVTANEELVLLSRDSDSI